MLDLPLYDRIRLSAYPFWQRALADGVLSFDYRHVEIVLEGVDRLPDHPVIYAMNHTDFFNYWPFLYTLHRRLRRYAASWVKGKNYEHPAVSLFMRATNNIPVASRGYLITRDFIDAVGRRPTEDEYRAIRDALDEDRALPAGAVPRALLDTPRPMMGRAFDPAREPYLDALDALFRAMMRRFLELNREAMALGLDILVFPQGARSVRLSRGHIGLMQAALPLGATIVPVGSNGCDLLYPGKSFRAKPGRVVYRIGEPLGPEVFADLAPDDTLEPFSREHERAHRARLQALTDRVMDRINDLLDERHRFADDHASDGLRGTARFL
jgi:1-acyl-sn-glycerol-3-phosphate acyltransferase